MRNHSIAALLIGLAILGATQAAHAQTVSNSRAAAIQQCSSMAGRYPETTFSSLEFELYRACMAQRGQAE